MEDTQTTTADDRPSSFAEHYAERAESVSSTDAPGTTTDDASSASAGTTAPQATTPDAAQAPTEAAGPIPFERHKAAIENARREAAERAAAEWKQYEWAKSVDRRAVEQAAQIGQMYQRDPAGYVRQMLAEAMQNEQLAPMVRSEAARLLAGARGHQAPAEVNLQPVPVQLDNGQVVSLYSAEQIAALKQQWSQELEQKFAPAMQMTEQFKAAQEQMVKQRDADVFAGSFSGELRKLPQFAEHKAEIAARLAQVQLQSDHPAEVKAAALAIYNEVVLPKLQQAEQQKAVATLQQKAVAQTVNPSRPAPSSGQRPRTFADLYAGRGR